MATANETVRDALVARQVDLLRFADGLGDRLVRELNRGEPALRASIRTQLERLGRTQARDRRVVARIDEVLRQVANPFADVGTLARSELVALAQAEQLFEIGLIEGAVPVALALTKVAPAALRAAVLGETFNGRMLARWFTNLRRADRERMVLESQIGADFGERPSRILRRLFGTRALRGADGVRETTRRQLRAIARSAVSHATNRTRQLLHEQNARVLRRELFVAVLDSRTTPICSSLDDRVFRVGVGPTPPIHIRCRSIRVPVIEGARLTRLEPTFRDLRGLSGQAKRARIIRQVGNLPGGLSYRDWLRAQPARIQDEILGRARGRLFRSGELDLSAFVDASGKRFTLQELAARQPDAFRAANVPLPTA